MRGIIIINLFLFYVFIFIQPLLYYLVRHFSIALYFLCRHYLADLAPAWRACSMLTWRWRLLRFLLRLSTTGGLATVATLLWLLSFSVTRSSP